MNRAVGVSKSAQVAQTLEREIRAGRVLHGDQLASEQALMRRFAVSRNTVRKGLEELARQGLITTRSGIGSFVTFEGATIDNAVGWTLALSRSDAEIETRTLEIRRGRCPEVAAALGLDDPEFLCVDRLRVLASDGTGLSLERSRMPWRDGFETTLDQGLPNGSLSETLAEAGLITNHGEEWASVLPALSPRDAAIMGRKPGQPMLRLRRVTRTSDGSVIESVESLLDPSRFGLHLAF